MRFHFATGNQYQSRIIGHCMRVKANKCALIFIVFLITSQINATVLYVRYTSNEIIIATDSKRTAETGQTVCVCKLSRIGDVFVASAGLAEYGSFDPKDFAREAIQSSDNLIEIRDRFEQLIQHPLLGVLKKVRVRNPTRYEVFKRGAAIDIVFVRFVDVPELTATALTPRDMKDGSIVLDSHPITLRGPVRRALRIAVGISKRADAFLDKPSFWAKGTVAGVERVMEMSIEDNTEAGAPIDLVQLTKGSVRWFPREPQCDERSRRVSDQSPTCNSPKQ
jgi:hypothetical protein